MVSRIFREDEAGGSSPPIPTMSTNKKKIREDFRLAVFARDLNKCRVCSARDVALDAHHITDRNLMPNGGYVLENGISLCAVCHHRAEHAHRTGTAWPGYAAEDLYKLINSSYELAKTKAAKC